MPPPCAALAGAPNAAQGEEELSLRLLLIIGFLATLPASSHAAPVLDRLVIIVPASAGGGFDKTAQSVATALRAEGIVKQIEIRRSPGAGGLIALAQFESQQAAPDPTVLIGGVTVLGAEVENHSLVSLTDLEPICQLTEVALALGVRKDSPIRSAGDLIEVMRSDPDRLSWVGGSPGSADEVLLWAMAAKLGVAHDHFRFTAFPGGGEMVFERLTAGPQIVAIRSYEEFASYRDRGKLRMLAISTAERFPGIALPTLRESGFDLVFGDWKGAFTLRGTSKVQRQAIGLAFDRLLASPAWSREVAAQGWRTPSDPKTGFEARIAGDRQRIKALLPGPTSALRWDSGLRDLLARPWRYALFGFFAAGLLALAALWQRRSAKLKEVELQRALAALEDIRGQISPGDRDNAGERSAIARQMSAWGLSVAELEIGWMILKGLQFKEIAAARGTSERTVRQQAQAIYAKSGLLNRSEFSAHFLEDLRF